MTIENFQPLSFNWDDIEPQTNNGDSGSTISKARTVGEITIRHVEYSNSYVADHWCEKGHILYIISGELLIDHADGKTHKLNTGMTYIIGDNTLGHKARTEIGATVLIID